MGEEYKLGERNGKQCRERWHNHLDPNIVKTDWTDKEEKTIFYLHKQYGGKWSEISRMLPGR